MSIRTIIAQALTRAAAAEGAGGVACQVTYPPQHDQGDYASNAAFLIARETGRSPRDVAEAVQERLQNDADVMSVCQSVEIAGPGFLNFFIKDETLQDIVREAAGDAQFGRVQNAREGTVLIEFSSPNTNKPLHLGHLRNDFLGMAIGNIMEALGHSVVRTEIVNDRGIHICKSMLAYQKWGKGETPESAGMKGDHFVGKYYVMYSAYEKDHPEILEEARQMLQRWEEGDPEVRALWEKMRTWALEGFEETYRKIGSRFDEREFESNIYDKGKDIVLAALEEGKVEQIEGGAIAIDLSEFRLGGRDDGKKILLRSDGTAMYITQDMYLAIQRWERHHPERMLYVVGDEQIYHFRVLFLILKLLGYEWVEGRYEHLAYGMVNLPEGKMKSREGTVVDADDLIASLEEMAEEEIVKRDQNTQGEELRQRKEKIALAALKFFILKVDPKTGMLYDPRQSLDFEGATGPYVQYTHARLSSILRKAEEMRVSAGDSKYAPVPEERALAALVARYPEVVADAGESLQPHRLAEYLLQISARVNSWYAKVPVLQSDPSERRFRLTLVSAVRRVVGNGLHLLGIDALERM